MNDEGFASRAQCAERVKELVGLDMHLVGVLLQGPDDDPSPYVQEDETQAQMFRGMTRLPAGRVARIVRAPAREFRERPDVIVAEGPVESLMWLVLADLDLVRGRRRKGETTVLQATCVDATLIPYPP